MSGISNSLRQMEKDLQNRKHTEDPVSARHDEADDDCLSSRSGGPPKIIVKKEPPVSPSMNPNSRHRPRKLDLSTNVPVSAGLSSRPSAGPLTGRDGLAMQDVGLACLSPGFQTQDPTLREQLQRSISVRDQQRSIIEARLLKTAKGDGPDGIKPSESNVFGTGPPTSSKKRPPPAGLSIVPPSAEQFANERVIQSAPLNHTFSTRHQTNPMTRHIANQPSNLSHTSHIHHVPAIQTSNRLPPISDVFPDTLAPSNRHAHHPGNSASNSSHSTNRPPFPSPGFAPHTAHPASAPSRPREFRSAEEAVHEMTGGREELLPRIVHYGGHQLPTPPSPLNVNGSSAYRPSQQQQMHGPDIRPGPSGRRRSRVEYEGDSSPPLGTGREKGLYGPFGAGRDSPETQRRKKDEFLGLCSKAWDLFHN